MKHTLLYHSQMPIGELARRLEESDGFLAVVNEGGKLLGVASDGDLRRGILNGASSLGEILNTRPAVIQSHTDLRQRERRALGLRQRYVPIVTHDMRLVEVMEVSPRDRMTQPNPVVIMAGGLGRRLGELTREVPKPMLPLGHKPILHIIVESFLEYGFSEFYFCVNYKSEVIREYFGDGSALGAQIHYIEENHPMGTAGPLTLIEKRFEHPFFVMYGDLVTTLNFEHLLHFHQEREALATLCTHEFSHQLPYGIVNTRNSRVLSLEEKPYFNCFVNAGIYVLDPAVIDMIPRNTHYDMTTLFDTLIEKDDPVHAYIINDFWVDIGQVRDYEMTRRVFTEYGI